MKRVGILTPMANWAVEAEMRHLLRADFAIARLVSPETDSQARLIDYGNRSAATAGQFGTMALAGIGFACTGTSYFIGADRETAIAASFDRPFVFAARAIRDRLIALGARSIALISPYPEALHRAGLAYFRSAGFEVSFDARVPTGSDDTRAIYALGGSEALPLIAQARASRPDAILLSGTGMPTRSMLDIAGSPPILSSNWALAAALDALAEERS